MATQSTMPSASVLEHMIYLAGRAPSPTNNQPWFFEVSKDSVVLKFEKGRASCSNEKSTSDLISLGAALENFRISAQAEGFDLQISYLDALNESDPRPKVAEIFFLKSASDGKKDSLLPFMRRRGTDRSKYSKKKLASEFIVELRQQTNNEVIILQDHSDLEVMSKAIGELDEIRLQRKEFHSDFFKSLRFAQSELQNKRDGIDAGFAGLPFRTSAVLKLLKKWPIFRGLNLFGLSKLFAAVTANRILGSAGVGVVCSNGDSLKSCLEAGMLYQRACCLAQKYGISFQPYTHFAEYRSERCHNLNLAKRRLQQLLPEGKNVLICFRLGYPMGPAPAKTFRYRLNKIMSTVATQTEERAFDYDTAFCRNNGLIDLADQEILKHSTVALPGLGGVGSQHIITLARLGVGGFHIADEDQYELKNFNRQYGATMSSIGREKSDVMEVAVREVNPEVRLKKWSKFIDKSNVDEFLAGCDILIDCVDAFSIETRRVLFDKAQHLGISVISAGPIGFSCSLIIIEPNSISFDEYINFREMDSEPLNFIRFILGVTPRPYYLKYMRGGSVDSGKRYGPSVATSIALCAGFAGVETLKILTGRKSAGAIPHYHYFDPYVMKFKSGYIPFGNKNPIQKLMIWIAQKRLLKK